MKVNEIKWPLSESDMMNMEMVWPETEEELLEVIRNVIKYEGNSYGTAARALTIVAEAAFNYIANVFGVSNFQASFAQLGFIIRMRHIKSGIKILNYDDLLYPQYLERFRITPEQCIKENASWLKEQAKQKLEKEDNLAAERVVEHWKFLANMGVTKNEE